MFEKISGLLLAGMMFLGGPNNTDKVDYQKEREIDFKEEVYIDNKTNMKFEHKLTNNIDLPIGTKDSPVSVGHTHVMKVDQKDLEGNVKSNNVEVRIDSVERLADTEKETPKGTRWIRVH